MPRLQAVNHFFVAHVRNTDFLGLLDAGKTKKTVSVIL